MVRWMAAAALIAGAALLPTVTAEANVITFARIAGWEAFGGVANDGQSVCGISTSGGGRWIGIKYYQGDNSLTIQLSKNTWQIPSGLRTKVTMQFDRESPWVATAKGGTNNGTPFLELDLPRQNIDAFLDEFKGSGKMYVRFPDEPKIEDWVVDLVGTSAIAGKMFACIQAMGN